MLDDESNGEARTAGVSLGGLRMGRFRLSGNIGFDHAGPEYSR